MSNRTRNKREVMRLALGPMARCEAHLFGPMSFNPAYQAPMSPPMRPYGIKPRVVGPQAGKQYVPSHGYSRPTAITLPYSAYDDIDREIGPNTYDRMEKDPTVTKMKNILITGATSDELQLAPGLNDDQTDDTEGQDEEFKKFSFVQAFCQDMIDGLERPYKGTLAQMMRNAIPYGHAIGEIEWEYRRTNPRSKGGPSSISPAPQTTTARLRESVRAFLHGSGLRTLLSASLFSRKSSARLAEPPAPKETGRARKQPSIYLMPASIKVKPRGAAYFVVDEYMTTLGLVPSSVRRSELSADEVISRDQFIVLTLNERDNDPRGRSEYWPIFTWWDFKQRVPKEYLLFLLQEAVPSAVGTLPQNLEPYEFDRGPDGEIIYEDGITDANGQPIPKMLTAAESFTRQIKDFRNGSGAVIPYEAKLEPFRKSGSKGQDDVFANAINTADRQMENGVLLQPLAQSEGQHQARSAAQEHANILFTKHFNNRWALAMMTLYDLLAVGVRLNLGEWALAYMPKISLGDSVPRDWAAEFAVVSDGYYKGFVDDTQRPPLMADFGMPRPGKSARQEEMERADSMPRQDPRTGTPEKKSAARPDKKPGGRPNPNSNAAVIMGMNYGPTRPKQYASYRSAR